MDSTEGDDRIRHYPCERCGAELAFQPGTRDLSCAYCGFSVAIELEEATPIVERDLEAMLAQQAEQRVQLRDATPDELEVRCPSCHASVVFRGTLTAQSCPYCTAPLQRSDVHRAEDRIPVDAVLPFGLEADAAREAIAQWRRRLWFAPDRFTEQAGLAGVQSLYLPFWTFDAFTTTRYRGRTKKNKQTFWRRRKGSFERFFDDVTIAGDETLADASLRQIEPWPLEKAVAYQPEYLTGLLAKTYATPLIEAWKRARGRMELRITSEVRSRIGGDSHRIDEQETQWNALSYKHVLLPVYIASIPHEKKVHRIIVNGANGRVAGDRPWSLHKFAALGVTLFVLSRIAAALGAGG